MKLSLRNPAESSISAWTRGRRWRMLIEHFPNLPTMSLLDLGGTASAWRAAPIHPKELAIVNRPDANTPELQGVLQADACDPTLLDGQRFDLVFSNSVIEHVGGHYRRQQFAENVYRLGEHHWIQTPYRFFPIEPHYLAPGIQFFPVSARRKIADLWPLGNFGGYHDTGRVGVEWALGIELLSKTSMRHYFPDSRIFDERLAGLTKSLIAIA